MYLCPDFFYLPIWITEVIPYNALNSEFANFETPCIVGSFDLCANVIFFLNRKTNTHVNFRNVLWVAFSIPSSLQNLQLRAVAARI
jgi:hypothetical protein